MNNEYTASDRFAQRLANFVIRRRWLVIAAALLFAAAAGSGARFLEFSNNYRTFFSPENPYLVEFESFQETYTKNDNILFVVQPGDGAVFTPRMMDAVERLTAEAWKIPYTIRVDSITNFQHSVANGDELTVDDLIRDGLALSQEELSRRKAVALAEPLLSGNLISHDADTTGINVTLQYPEESLNEVPESAAYARGVAAEIQREFGDVHIAISGVSMLNNAFGEAGTADAMTLVPLMYLVLVGVMIFALRSLSATFATVLVVGMSTVTSLGIAGYLGIKVDPISVTAPTIILTLAIADSIHILISMFGLMREGKNKLEALKESIRINFLAVGVTSATTVVGFLALNASDAPPFWYLGNMTAIGITAAFVYSVTFLPALVSLLPVRVRAREQRSHDKRDWLDLLGGFVVARYKPILVVSAIVALSLTAFVPTIDLNDEWVKYSSHRIQFRNDAEFGIEHLNGIYFIEYSVESQEAGGISEPEYLRTLESFTGWLREQPEVTHVYSYSDIIKRLNKNMHGDDPGWHVIPENRELAAQYLLLFELSLPFGLDLNDRINIDKSATRVTATVGQLPTKQLRGFLDRSEQWLTENAPAYMHAFPTGASVMFSHISEQNINSMLKGNAMAVLLIALIMMMALRSLSLGALSLVPNVLPILMTFGAWALLVNQVGMAAAMVSATSLGIVVDSTVHFLSKYLRARREKNQSPSEAIRYTFRMVGKALVVNALILTFGFGVLALSTFRINAEMGLLTALAIVIALAVDFLLLPSLLLIAHKPGKGEVYDEKAIPQGA